MSQRPLRALFADSALLFRRSAARGAVALCAGLIPGAALVALALWATGLTSPEALADAVEAGSWPLALAVGAAGLGKRLLAILAFAAVVRLVDAERRDEPRGVREAYVEARGLLLPLILTAARAALRVLAGLLALVVPGVVLAYRYSLAHFCVLTEGLRGQAALDRSRALLTGRARWALTSLGAATLVAVALDLAATILLKGSAQTAIALGARPLGPIEGQLQLLLQELASGMIGCWLTGFTLLLYRDLAD